MPSVTNGVKTKPKMATYTTSQINQFYDRIDLPSRWRLEPGAESQKTAQGDQGLEYLSVLHRYTLANVPFENLELHYSRTKTIDLHPEVLFRKIVSQNTGRGGYCMENNHLFAIVLRTLGFQLYSTSGRVNSSASPNGEVGEHSFFYGFAHHVNIVTIQGARYFVDVGFGAGTAVRPLSLDKSLSGKEYTNIAPEQDVRLRFDTIDEYESDSKVWIFEKRNRKDGPWATMYCFPDDVEFTAGDFMVFNHFTSTSRQSFFTYMVLVVKFILSEDGEEIVGEHICMANRYFRRVAGKKEGEVELKSEPERVQLLKEKFGITLDGDQQSGILGMASMVM